ncbi:hypothetical protein LCY76_17790 [Fictibacillus sp. KIGAM418]|uniref:Uncharacterized protein n=1 Tax=Fictibacillus marinisediminis TaxID=2878389 RepID=A0A9X2BE03_9BACL|nr:MULTISPECIES: hypothetical protein [Fictibacillus]MCK6258429.1 hypothetical protein [Fictibacillus marinisediminis]MED2971106.1 hypothetical protein [Fictibacillus sp. B-59209]UZJ79930.1 hypothetical protein OKX00_05500 [Fictibacillus sp. KU28468]SFD47799.1 hypothetical protein SAMN05428981_101574 [Bacillus sp. OV194]
MILSHQLTPEEKEKVKQLKSKINRTDCPEEKSAYENQLIKLMERIFIRHKLQRRNEL